MVLVLVLVLVLLVLVVLVLVMILDDLSFLVDWEDDATASEVDDTSSVVVVGVMAGVKAALALRLFLAMASNLLTRKNKRLPLRFK